MSTATTRVKDNHLGGVLVTTAALGSAAGGLIHLNQIGAHPDFLLMAGGFALMGVAQWVFALVVLRRPSHPIIWAGGILHAAIFALWLVTRTVGLEIVPGAEVPAEVGLADLVANIFSVAVIGVAAIGTAVHEVANPVVLPPGVATRLKTIVVAGVILLTVPALLVPHEHGSHAPETPAHETSDDHASDPTHVGEHDPVHSHSTDFAPTAQP